MPEFDRTGPDGEGPMTGRRLGYCGRAGRRVGFRRGFGRGFGWRTRTFQPVQVQEEVSLTKDEEKKILEQELKELESEKKEIEKRFKELK